MTAPRLLVAFSVVLYAVSLTGNTFCTHGDCNTWPGWGVLLLGWFEPVAIEEVGPFVAFGWVANPCVFLTWVFVMTSSRLLRFPAAFFALMGLSLGLAFLLGKTVLTSENGNAYAITGYGAGYWIWIVSLSIALGAAILNVLLKESGSEGDE